MGAELFEWNADRADRADLMDRVLEFSGFQVACARKMQLFWRLPENRRIRHVSCRNGTQFRKRKQLRCFCRRDVCNPHSQRIRLVSPPQTFASLCFGDPGRVETERSSVKESNHSVLSLLFAIVAFLGVYFKPAIETPACFWRYPPPLPKSRTWPPASAGFLAAWTVG